MRHQRGVTLIENLVALFVVTVGILGMSVLQIRTSQYNDSAFKRSQTSVLAYYLADAMRANRDAALAGAYDLPLECGGAPSGSSLAQSDLREWIAALRRDLGDAVEEGSHTTCGGAQCDANGSCQVQVRWAERGPNATPYTLDLRMQL